MTTQSTTTNPLRGILRQRNFHLAERALGYAATQHTGTRLDGSPEISHQVEIAYYLIGLPMFPGLERALAEACLHDVREDRGVSDCALRSLFGSRIADDLALLTKSFRGVSLPIPYAFGMPARSAIAAIVKGADRIHNLRTMDGAFSPSKQGDYRQETRTHILPMLHLACRRFPEHGAAIRQIISDTQSLASLALDTRYSREEIQ